MEVVKAPDAAKPVEPNKTDAKAAPAVDPNAGKEKYVVNGKEVWLSPEQARAYVQKGLAFEPRMSELARLQQESQTFLQTLKTNPEKILFNEKLGMSPLDVLKKIMGATKVDDATKEAVGRWYYENVIQPQQQSPEQRELAEARRKLAAVEEQQKKANEEAIRAENVRRVQMAMEETRAKIKEAMAESGLPSIDTPLGMEMARRVADVMRLAFIQKKAITPKDAIGVVKKQILETQKAFYDSLADDALVDQIGKENAEKIRKYFLKQVKQSQKDAVTTAKPPKRDERKTMTPDQFRDYLAEMKNGSK